eukprot:6252565-Prymnesium_polylepis.2
MHGDAVQKCKACELKSQNCERRKVVGLQIQSDHLESSPPSHERVHIRRISAQARREDSPMRDSRAALHFQHVASTLLILRPVFLGCAHRTGRIDESLVGTATRHDAAIA